MKEIEKFWSFVDENKIRKSIIKLLDEFPMTITEISECLNMKNSNVSVQKDKLIRKNLIYIVNDYTRQKRKYSLTDLGIEVLKLIKERDKKRKLLKNK